MLIVERMVEMCELSEAFAEISGGEGRLVVLTGASGTGKTALLQAFGAELPVAARFWFAAGAPAESQQQLGVLTQLLRHAALEDSTDLSSAEALLALGEAESQRGAMSAATAHRLGAAIADLARQQSLVILVDDVHYADAASLQILSYLLRRLPALPVLIVVAEPLGPPALPLTFQAELLRFPKARRIGLAPLSAEGVADALTGYVGGDSAARLAGGFFEVTGGNPLLVRAVAEEFYRKIERGDSSGRLEEGGVDDLADGDALGQAALACLYSGDESAVRVGSAMAVLGEHATIDRIVRLTGVELCVVKQVVRSLSAAGLVAAARYRHSLLGAAVAKRLPVIERIALHQGVAALLFDEGRAAVEVAAHLIAGGPSTEPWAGRVLRDAATEALRNDGTEFALECLRSAACACVDECERTAIDLIRVAVESRIDPAFASRWLDRLVASVTAGHLKGGDVLELTQYLVWHGRLEEAEASLSVLADGPGSTDWHTVDAIQATQSWLRFICPPLAGATPTTHDTQDRNWLHRPSVGRRPGATEILLAVIGTGASPQTVTVLDELLAGWSWKNSSSEEALVSLLALVYAGRSDIAVQWCDALLRDANLLRAPSRAAFLTCTRALIAEHQGDPILAEECASQALGLISVDGWGVAIGAPLAILISACTTTGRTDSAASWLSHPVPGAMFHTPFGLNYLHARGEYQLALGRSSVALEDFAACGDLMRQWNIDTPTYLPWRTSAASVYLALGDHARARELAEEQRERPGADTPRVKAISLRIAAATRPPRERPALLQEALMVLSKTKETAESVRALAELSQAFRDLGVSGRARSTARKAWTLASSSGLEVLCTQRLSTDLMAHLHVIEESDADLGEAATLTDSEMAVARLAALEYTNREISRKMNVTVSTVEQHLTRVYRKLGVRGRKEIGLVLRMYIAETA
ncbi:AAA family ATPase [Nocardia sp. NPDC046473]|uniref:helix-turn-helix transcriptional regulator n=1 Tax=Nocardia sp. NPDC046473 TaxID=3155733 RepID=UPI0033D90C05